MGIYKVIKIRLPKLLQRNNKKTIKKNILKKNILKKSNYSTRHKKRNSFSHHTMKSMPKKYKKRICINKMKLKYIIILLFFALVLIKGIMILHYHSEQKEVQNTDAVVETKTNFFVKESLPY